jgi:hypothetical protein
VRSAYDAWIARGKDRPDMRLTNYGAELLRRKTASIEPDFCRVKVTLLKATAIDSWWNRLRGSKLAVVDSVRAELQLCKYTNEHYEFEVIARVPLGDILTEDTAHVGLPISMFIDVRQV